MRRSRVTLAIGLTVHGEASVPVAATVFRLSGHYFAIGTWVVAEVFRILASQVSALGGGSAPGAGMKSAEEGWMLYLYHGTTSVCSVKVRLALAEKNLAWEGEILHLQRGDQHRPEYVKINPNAVVPTLVHDGRVVIESTLISEYLDETFPAPPLMPDDTYRRAVARLWMKKIDDYLHAACSTITFAVAFRPLLLRKSAEELEAHFNAMPDPVYRERQRLSIERGIEAPHVPPALRNYDRYIGEMEQALADSPYLAGEAYSLADVAATPYLNRAEVLGLERLWAGRRPRVADWLARMRARPSYDAAVTRVLIDDDRKRFDVPREETWKKASALLGLA